MTDTTVTPGDEEYEAARRILGDYHYDDHIGPDGRLREEVLDFVLVRDLNESRPLWAVYKDEHRVIDVNPAAFKTPPDLLSFLHELQSRIDEDGDVGERLINRREIH